MQGSDITNRIREHIQSLPPTMRRVAQYMDRNRVEVVGLSAAELGAALGTSDATVVRTAKALGYDGLADLKRCLTRELSQGTPVDNFQRTLRAAGADARKAAARSIATAQEATAALAQPDVLDRVQRVIDLLDAAHRIVVFGIGPTAHLAGYFALQLRRLGRRVLVLDATGRDMADAMLDLGAGDAVLLLSYGHPYAEVLALVEDALMQSLPIALITNAQDNPLAKTAQEVIVLPRGGAHGMALSAASFICIEALIVGLSICAPEATRARLSRLEQLRASLDRQV